MIKIISAIVRDSSYHFSLFNQSLLDQLERKITIKNNKPTVVCIVRDKEIVLKPEEDAPFASALPT